MANTNSTKRSRGGNVKKVAPPGFYTAKEARDVLGMNQSTFSYYVRKGKIERMVPPGKTEGYYEKSKIKRLANQMAVYMHAIEKALETEVRTALPEDTPGIVKILTDMGWKTATAEQRRSWYKVNPYIDYVVLLEGDIMGYINAAPYIPEVMNKMLAGKMRSWEVKPEHIRPFTKNGELVSVKVNELDKEKEQERKSCFIPGKYDLYVGIATNKDIPNHTQRFGFRLISGFLSFLEDISESGVIIHNLFAASDQPDGMKLCESIGFKLLPRDPEDKFNKYRLDLMSSDSIFAKKYRNYLRKGDEV